MNDVKTYKVLIKTVGVAKNDIILIKPEFNVALEKFGSETLGNNLNRQS